MAGAGGHSELDVMAAPHHRISLVGRERAALAANREDVWI
jgi:hypothetical protein